MHSSAPTRKLFSDSLLNIGRLLLTSTLGLISTIILVNAFGAEGFGMYTLALLLPTIFVRIFNLGTQFAITYHVARRQDELPKISAEVLWIALGIGLVSTGMGALLIRFASALVFPNVPVSLLYLSLPIVMIVSLLMDIIAIFRGLEEFDTATAIEIVPQIMILVLTILFVLVFDWGVAGGILAVVLSRLWAAVLAVRALLRRVDISLRLPDAQSRRNIRQILRYGLTTELGLVADLVNYRADVLLLNGFIGPAAVGIYDVAVLMIERLWIVSQAVGHVVLARVATLDDDAARGDVTTITVRAVFWVTALGALVAFLLADWAIPLFFGAGFGESAAALQILLPGIVSMGVARLLIADITGRGRPGINSVQTVISAVLNVALNLYLIPRYGVLGAAFATTISYTALLIMKMRTMRRLAGVRWRDCFVPRRSDVRLILSLLRRLARRSSAAAARDVERSDTP